MTKNNSGQPMILRFLIDVQVKVVDHSRVRSNTKKPCAQTAQSFSQIKPFRTQSCLAAYFTWPQVAITHHVSNKEFSEYRTAGQPRVQARKPNSGGSVGFIDCGTFHTLDGVFNVQPFRIVQTVQCVQGVQRVQSRSILRVLKNDLRDERELFI